MCASAIGYGISSGVSSVETAITTGLVLVMGEITTGAYVDIQKIVRETIREIGYTRGKYGFDADTCGVITAIASVAYPNIIP